MTAKKKLPKKVLELIEGMERLIELEQDIHELKSYAKCVKEDIEALKKELGVES